MSRIGKLPIPIPRGTEVSIGDEVIHVKGPKGQRSHPVLPKVSLRIEGQEVVVERSDDSKAARALHGTMRARLANLIEGVTQGYERRLELQGVGYSAEMAGQTLKLRVGYSHPVEFKLPEGVAGKVERNVITLTGNDKQELGETMARIRRIRPPEHYKGKGIRYAGETVRIKEGKKNA